jgi:hypothetical protein
MMAVFSVAIWTFYFAVKFTGGRGVRTEGRTVVDKPVQDEESLPPE